MNWEWFIQVSLVWIICIVIWFFLLFLMMGDPIDYPKGHIKKEDKVVLGLLGLLMVIVIISVST